MWLRLYKRPWDILPSKYRDNLQNIIVQLFICRCVDDYTDAEQDLIIGLVNGVANFECIQNFFAKACNVYVSNYVKTMLGLPSAY